ncbi:MAG: peptidase [Gemmatimonadetes bacterium]|nr:peptidase [Gemmatimonadota bacterium]
MAGVQHTRHRRSWAVSWLLTLVSTTVSNAMCTISVRTLLLFASLTSSIPSIASCQGLTAQVAYDSANAMRDKADPLWRAGDARGLAILFGTVRFLEMQSQKDLAGGWVYLRGRLSNTWKDIALAETVRGDSANALHAFEMIVLSGGAGLYADVLRKDSIAERWKGNARYERVITQLRRQRAMWRDSAFVTPFRDTLPERERLAGLSLLWAEVRYGYPDFQQRPDVSWDSLYIAYIPRVQAARRTRDYYQVLRRFTAELGDGHTDVGLPAGVANALGSPPLTMRRVEGQTLITAIRSPTLEAMGLRVGDQIETVDGMAVETFARTQVAPYLSVATSQDLEWRAFGTQLLYGPLDSAVMLGIRHAGGQQITVRVPRGGYAELSRPSSRPVVDSMLPGNVGYLRIDAFTGDSLLVEMRRAMTRFARTSALIIDVRYNVGGNTYFGDALLATLLDTAVTTETAWARSHSAYERARNFEPQVYDHGEVRILPDTSLHYGAPVTLLVGPRTFSAAENFAAGFVMAHRGMLVGEPTSGNTGQPMSFPLPGGGAARVRTRHHVMADGTEYLFTGIQPNKLVTPTVDGIRAGRDEVLAAALALRGGTRQGP